jgi:serine/threonine protein kinase
MPNLTLGPYTLLRRIAVGGMAEIFLAHKTHPDHPEKQDEIVAVKRILPHLSTLKDFRNMFLDETRLAARLRHPNVVEIHDFGQFDGTYFLAMEYVLGEDLLSIMRRAGELRNPMPPALAATLLVEACKGLHYAHELKDEQGAPLGIVHRDVTPANLLVSYEGVLKLADFGIAKAERRISHTATGALKGKYAYMSPEYAMGDSIDRRADVFSLGIVAHEILTGQRLFHRENQMAVLEAITRAEVPRPATLRKDIPDELDEIVMRALERDVDERFPSAEAMQADLEGFLRTRDPQTPPLSRYLRSLFGDAHLANRRKWVVGIESGDPTRMLDPPVVARHQEHTVADAVLESFALDDATTTERQRPELETHRVTLDKPRRQPMVLLLGAVAVAAAIAALLPLFRTRGTTAPQVTTVKPISRPAHAGQASATDSAWSYLSLSVSPELEVLLDGQSVGKTPLLRQRIAPGPHTLTLVSRTEGYRIASRFSVAAGAEHRETRALGKGTLRVTSSRGTEVYVGERRLGLAPLRAVPMTEGTYDLRLVAPGTHKEKRLSVTVAPGQTTNLHETLD